MKRKNILVSVVAATLLATTGLQAESTTLDSIDVWETEVVSSSVNLGQGTIETKQADHLSDLLRDIPGVDVGGTHSINNRINIRSLQDENLDITLDGAKIQNVNMFHHIGNLLINPDILKKAEIQVGTNSVVNGSLGGTVAFETKDGKDLLEEGKDFGARVSTSYNSNDSLGGSVSVYGKVLENADMMIYHNYINKNNWKDGEGVETFGSDGKIQNTLLKFGVDLSDTQRITLSYDNLKDEGDYSPRPDFGRAYNEARTGLDTFPTEYTRDTITLNHELNLGDNLVLNTSIYSNENELERKEGPLTSGSAVRPPWGITVGNNFSGLLNGKVKTVGINSKAQSNIEAGDTVHILTYGLLYDKQTSKVTWNGAKYGEDESAKSLAFYLEDSMVFDNGLVLTPGIRYNKYDFDGAYGEINDNEITYGLASEYLVNDNLTLLASATTLYKGVEMVDVLATNRIAVANNTDLKSETGINKEIGFRYEKKNALGADNIGFQFKYFNTEIDDYINQEYNAMSNVGTLDIKGFEASFAYVKGNFNTLITYAKSDSNLEDSGEPMVKEQGDSISIGIDYKLTTEVDISWESIFVFEEDDRPTGAEYLVKQAYNVHDVSLKWLPRTYKGLTVIAGIDNVFDESYVSHTSENRTFNVAGTDYYTKDYEPGRNFKVTLAYKF